MVGPRRAREVTRKCEQERASHSADALLVRAREAGLGNKCLRKGARIGLLSTRVSATLPIVLTQLAVDQRRAIALYGTPLAVEDPSSPARAFVLLEVHLNTDILGGFLASVPGMTAVGSGDTPIEASIALTEAMRASMAF